jgi:hypothetical protein
MLAVALRFGFFSQFTDSFDLAQDSPAAGKLGGA